MYCVEVFLSLTVFHGGLKKTMNGRVVLRGRSRNRYMKILHVGASASLKQVNGVNAAVWLISTEQALLGHEVTLLLDSPPDLDAQQFAEQTGIGLAYVGANSLRFDARATRRLIEEKAPDIVHRHSVFIPRHAFLCMLLRKSKIPYIITPHAMSGQLLKRGRIRKWLYGLFVEKPRFRRAAGITGVTPREGRDIAKYVGNYRGPIRCIFNPIDASQMGGYAWNISISPKKVVYLGRYDVMTKGLDVLLEIARALPADVEVHLYGTRDRKTQGWFDELTKTLPANVTIHGPVFGVDKVKALSGASIYIQTSRWETFGISIAEAMFLGVPCALAETVNLSEVFRENDLGLVLPSEPGGAAKVLSAMLHDEAKLTDCSKRGRAFAEKHFEAQAIAKEYVTFYREVLRR